MKNIRFAILFYLMVFVFLFLFTLNFNYVEGDDAATILYHLCGQNPEIQKPYAPYNSGLDFILQLSGLKSEAGLRTFAVVVSFISGLLVLILLAVLLETFFEDSQIVSARQRFYFYLLLPLLLPDVIFHSLIINASNVSFVFVLASLIFALRFLKNNNNSALLWSAVLFAIAIPFRWTMLIALPLYTGFFLYYHPIQNYPRTVWTHLLKILLSNLAGVAMALFLIRVTGYDLNDMRETVISTAGYMEKSDVSALSMLASGSAFLTPALILLALFGLLQILLLHQKRIKSGVAFLSLLLLSVSPFLLLGFYPLYKYSMTALPVILILMLFGFGYLQGKQILSAIFIFSVFVPWFAGIEIDASGTFCGPGFEMDVNKVSTENTFVQTANNPDNRIKIKKIKPTFSAGFYMPMAEGPRPLYGYFDVLFCGKWNRQINLFTQERDAMLAFLETHRDAAYFQEGKFYFLCDLYRHGFTTQTGDIKGKAGTYRIFTNGTESLAVHEVPAEAKVSWMKAYMQQSAGPVVFRSSYSNDILKLAGTPGIKILGPFTAIKEK